YMFGYSYHADQLRDRNLQFDWDIKNFPQTRGASGTKYYADYWVNVVSKKSDSVDAAWNFIQSATSKDLVVNYLDTNKKPTALSLLEHINDYTQKKVTTNDGYYLSLSHATMPNLKLHTRNNMLTSIEFYDSFDYMNKLLFANILSDIKLSKNTFVFIPSNDVEIIKQ
ncbi:MAG: hypothetical protein HON42_02625, partial [Alphaproteobacteria bacterium]|nr:hypothetical protein [Alphaproteobacteria bacterium]